MLFVRILEFVSGTRYWEMLIEYLGGPDVAGGKLKAPGTLVEGTGFWVSPNTGAANESGFSALPGGVMEYRNYKWIGERSIFKRAQCGNVQLDYNSIGVNAEYTLKNHDAAAVRCIQDPE